MAGPETMVIPGLGSPESPLYQEVYRLIADEAERREMPMRCLKYKGAGHLVDGHLDGEITLSGAAQAIVEDVKSAAPGSFLICRSFGCLLPGYLAEVHGLDLRNFRRVVLWGPVPYFHMWKLFGTPSKISDMNVEAETKGARLSTHFFESIVPQEKCCEALTGTEVIVALGTKDRYTDPPFIPFLASIIKKGGNFNVHERIVPGAPHEVTAREDDRIIRCYLNALFG